MIGLVARLVGRAVLIAPLQSADTERLATTRALKPKRRMDRPEVGSAASKDSRIHGRGSLLVNVLL